MSMTKHNHRLISWADLDLLANRMGRIFNDSGLGNLTYGANWVPSVSVEERDQEILLTAELPGMTDDSVEITLENNVLTISGEKREVREEGETSGKYHLVERGFGAFRRSFTLPRTVRADGITADFEHGPADGAPAQGRGGGQPQDRRGPQGVGWRGLRPREPKWGPVGDGRAPLFCQVSRYRPVAATRIPFSGASVRR